MDDYISKPVNPDELGRILTRWLPKIKRDRKSEIENQTLGEKTSESETGNTYLSSKPAFDKKALMERVCHDNDFAREILTIYMESAAPKNESLKEFLAKDKIEQATRDAHSIRGNAGNCGCLAVAEAARRMEKAGLSGNIDEMKRLLPELEKQHELCLVEINRYLDSEV